MAQRRMYDRLPEESSKAYDAFVVYRDLGVSRSIEIAWQRYSKSDKRVPGYFKQWSATYNWVERAAAYDDHIEAEARKVIERDAIKRKADMLKRHAQTGKALQSFGLTYLNDKKQPDKAADAISAIKSGVDMERKSEGLPEYLLEIMNADDNELTRAYNQLLTEIGGDRSGDETPGDSDTDEDASAD